MKRTTVFRRLLEAQEILILPGAHDALTAKIIAQCGFKAFPSGSQAAPEKIPNGFATPGALNAFVILIASSLHE